MKLKKDRGRFTVRFDMENPDHVRAVEYLERQRDRGKALAIKSIGGEDIDGSSFCEFRVRPMVCFSKYSCTICSIKARSVC